MFNRKEIVVWILAAAAGIMNDVDWPSIKIMRKHVLTECDYMFLSDQTPSQEWIDYRQFLRDLPQNFTEANDAADAWNQYNIPE